VLVQEASLPRKEELPEPLAALATRQAATLDHAEFHDDCERLCDRLAPLIEDQNSTHRSLVRRWWPAAAVVAVLALAVGGYVLMQTAGEPREASTTQADPPTTGPSSTEERRQGVPGDRERNPPAIAAGRTGGSATVASGGMPADTKNVEALLDEALIQRRRYQFVEALATLTRARETAPTSEAARRMQEDVAMDWIRSVRVESGKSSFGEAIKPALAVVDAALPTSTGERRADLLAHSGWATFLMWRDGNRRLNPAEWYRDALSVDPENPYANAMLAHWILLQEDDVPRAAKLFDTALRKGRAVEAIRTLQWAGYGNTQTPEADAERVRLADAMRRGGERPNPGQAQALWARYYFAMPAGRGKDRQVLLDALPADDHIATLAWAFDEYAAKDESRRRTIRYYVALLHASAGRVGQAAADLRTLNKDLTEAPGSLQDAVRAALTRLQSGRRGRAAL
jgi:hypothetical protein